MQTNWHYVKVSLSDQEVTRLEELRGDEERAVYLRRLLHEPPKGAGLMLRLLPQPGRFEGALPIGEANVQTRHPVLNREQVRVLQLHLDSVPLQPVEPDADWLDPLDFDVKRSQGSRRVFQNCLNPSRPDRRPRCRGKAARCGTRSPG
jgi:hypothetical protein